MNKASGGSHQKKRKTFVPWKAGKNDCLYCRRDLGTEVRIHCAVCPETAEGEPPSFCVDCFGSRVELGGHKSSHDYKIVDTPSVCLLSEDWTADEELRFDPDPDPNPYPNSNPNPNPNRDTNLNPNPSPNPKPQLQP